ncbi:MAG: tyrosine-type recombinase/integrase [Psychrobium sp.]
MNIKNDITDYNVINDDLVIMKQNSAYWYAQVKTPPELGIPDNRKRVSTKIKIGTLEDYYNAVAFGLKLVAKHQVLQEEGLPLFDIKPTVKSVALKVIKEIEQMKIKRKTHKDYIRILEKEIIPQLGHLYFKDLQIKELKEFYHNKKAKSQTRITLTNTTFDKLFFYAVEHKIINQRDKPEFKRIKIEKEITNEQVIFRESDFELINENYESFINNATNRKSKENRELLKLYIEFLKNTGIRSGEETKIKWKDIYQSGDRIVISLKKGKMGERKKSRDIAIDKPTFKLLVALLRKRMKIDNPLKEESKDYVFHYQMFFSFMKSMKVENEYIFQRTDNIYPNFLDSFNQLKEHLKDRLSDDKLTLYSFRHYFITDRLLNGIDIYKLAKYVGNSVEVIQKSYSKVTSRLASEHVVKDLDIGMFN